MADATLFIRVNIAVCIAVLFIIHAAFSEDENSGSYTLFASAMGGLLVVNEGLSPIGGIQSLITPLLR